MELSHVLEFNQSRKELDEVLKKTAMVKTLYRTEKGKNYLRQILRNKVIVLLFNQPSTRTRTKFELAGKYLGADVLVINEIAYTSMVKGESWRNTIKTYAKVGADIIVIRHPQDLIPKQAAYWCDNFGFKTKIINAGDGHHEHPTQVYQDLYTLKEHFGKRFGKEELNIALGADLKNARVLHSLVEGLARYPVKLTLVSWQPPSKTFSIPRKYLRPLIENKRKFREVEKLTEGEKFDVIYWIRYQIEHGREKLQRQYNQDFRITPDFLKMFLKDDGIFLHPGPRDGEIDDKIDADSRVKDGLQVENGLFTSMALYLMMLRPEACIPKPSGL